MDITCTIPIEDILRSHRYRVFSKDIIKNIYETVGTPIVHLKRNGETVPIGKVKSAEIAGDNISISGSLFDDTMIELLERGIIAVSVNSCINKEDGLLRFMDRLNNTT